MYVGGSVPPTFGTNGAIGPDLLPIELLVLYFEPMELLVQHFEPIELLVQHFEPIEVLVQHFEPMEQLTPNFTPILQSFPDKLLGYSQLLKILIKHIPNNVKRHFFSILL